MTDQTTPPFPALEYGAVFYYSNQGVVCAYTQLKVFVYEIVVSVFGASATVSKPSALRHLCCLSFCGSWLFSRLILAATLPMRKITVRLNWRNTKGTR